jgi:AcrR family transcriptional regulator
MRTKYRDEAVGQEPADGSSAAGPVSGDGDRRRRGRRPADASERRRRVEQAIADLESVRGVPFTMADLAERAGISRATLYRDAGLRDLVGDRGDGPAQRPVDSREHARLRERAEALAAERRTLRREMRDLTARMRAAEDRVDALEALRSEDARDRRATGGMDPEAAERLKREAYAEGFTAGVRTATQRPGTAAGRAAGGSAAAGELRAVAARLPRASLVTARRTLARQLHPDLFVKDPAAAMLATELLKQINALIGPNGG